MPDFSINGLGIKDAVLSMPRVGVWTLDAITQSVVAPITAPQKVAVGFGDLSLVGTTVRGGSWRGSEYIRIMGGLGGLGKDTTPQGFLQVPLSVIVQSVLAAAGETLSPTVTPASLPTLFRPTARWMVRREPVSTALTRLAEKAGATWRVLPDGTIWIGIDLYRPQSITGATLMDQHPEQGEEYYGVVSPALLPGASLLSQATLTPRPVSRVDYDIDLPACRMTVWYEDNPLAQHDRLIQPLANIVTALTEDLRYRGDFPCLIVAQNPDRSLEVQPEDTSLPGMSSVPMMFGTPATTASLVGGRAIMAFENGSPDAPFIRTYDSSRPGALSTTMYGDGLPAIGSSDRPVARGPGILGYPLQPGDGVYLIPSVLAFLTALSIAGGGDPITNPVGYIGSGSPKLKLGGGDILPGTP